MSDEESSMAQSFLNAVPGGRGNEAQNFPTRFLGLCELVGLILGPMKALKTRRDGYCYNFSSLFNGGHHATSRKVAGFNPDEVIGFFN
jgi:hypothetical protein